MRRLPGDMNPTVRGFLIIALVALAIVLLQLYQTLVALALIAQIVFAIAVAVFVYLAWRERRGEIGEWPARAQAAFYGGALVIVSDLGAFWLVRPAGIDAVAFLAVVVLCGLAMVRTWRDQHTYS